MTASESLWDRIVSPYWHLNEPRLMHRHAEGDAARRAARTEWFERARDAAEQAPEGEVRARARSEFIEAYARRGERWGAFASRFRNSDDFQAVIHGFLNVGERASWTLFLWGPVVWCWYLARWCAGRDSLRVLARAAHDGRCGDCGYQVERRSAETAGRWADVCASLRCPECGNSWPCLPPEVPN